MRCNQCLELALSHGEDLTHLAWIEADLSYPYDTLEALVGRDKPIIAPLIYLNNNTFYDGWGFRDLNGVRITQFPPMMPVTEGEPIELRSVGSFVVFDIAVFRSNIRFRGEYEQGLLVGISEDAAKIGLKTFVDPMISIFHPVSAWREQMWYCKRLRVFADGTPTVGYRDAGYSLRSYPRYDHQRVVGSNPREAFGNVSVGCRLRATQRSGHLKLESILNRLEIAARSNT